MTSQMSRREALRLAAPIFAIGSGGCLSSNATGSPSQTPTASPSSTDTPDKVGAAPVPSCPDGYKTSYDPWWTVVGPGPLEGMDLTINKETYTKGEQLVAKLRNVTDQEKKVGSDGKIDIQYQGTDSWHTIFGVPEDQDAAFPQVGVFMQPNEGYTWEFTLSKAGLSAGKVASFFHACHPIEPGQYRFVYWGVGDAQEAIGAPFSVVRDQA